MWSKKKNKLLLQILSQVYLSNNINTWNTTLKAVAPLTEVTNR